MKILLVSMNNLHFRRWSDQLRDSGHEVYWFDILDQGYAPSMSWMKQVVDWKKGFLKKRGRSVLKKNLPSVYRFLSKKLDVKVEIAFAKAIKEIQPDVVHSFALYIACAPILPVMIKNPQIKWVYSSWGSDLYYFKNVPEYLVDIKNVLPHIQYLFADCKRDYAIAQELGFKGEFLGVYPGGGGFDLEKFDEHRIHFENRKIIAVKGYENRSGRALKVLEALEHLKEELKDYEVVVFGAENEAVIRFGESEIPNIQILSLIAHDELITLLSKSLIYIGNSNSDGLPNTLLEAICAGAFPIQSNPGGATEEVIIDKQNGLLIEDCEDIVHIAATITIALKNDTLRRTAVAYNTQNIKPFLSFENIKRDVLESYNRLV